MLDRHGVNYSRVEKEFASPSYPWGYVKPAETVMPFVTSASYGWYVEALNGEGGRLYSVCIFGYEIFR